MTNISFKAQLFGINNPQKAQEFHAKTGNNSDDYKLTYLYKDKNTDWDVFQLTYKDNEIIRYPNIKNSKNNQDDYSVDELLKIYKLLRLKCALRVVEHLKQEKRNLEFEKYWEELNKNKGI